MSPTCSTQVCPALQTSPDITFLNFQIVFPPFYPFCPAWSQFISEAQRSCVTPASPSHLQRNPSTLWIKKTMESCCDPFKWLHERERMENAALILPPHPCNTDKHLTGDISARTAVRGSIWLRQRAHIHLQTWNHLGVLLYTVNQNSPWSLTNL